MATPSRTRLAWPDQTGDVRAYVSGTAAPGLGRMGRDIWGKLPELAWGLLGAFEFE
jgi:hypothetical protein